MDEPRMTNKVWTREPTVEVLVSTRADGTLRKRSVIRRPLIDIYWEEDES